MHPCIIPDECAAAAAALQPSTHMGPCCRTVEALGPVAKSHHMTFASVKVRVRLRVRVGLRVGARV